jgi:ElaB/YqjD/DUF883 family membrane-anchored ribosome-binding protein
MARHVNVLEETAKRTQAELDEIISDSDSDLDDGMDDQMRGVREQLNSTLKKTRSAIQSMTLTLIFTPHFLFRKRLARAKFE